MADSALYQQIVLDHYRKPRNRGALAAHTHAADGVNPLCGDSLRLEVRFEDGRVVALGFTGEACAITTAAVSMLGEVVAHCTPEDVAALAESFRRVVDCGAEDPRLGSLNAMRELQRHPARRKCALLPWATLRAALAGDDRASTEGLDA